MSSKAVAAPNGQRGFILDHAAQLFLRKGYRAATMDDLAAAVKLNKATVYYYFKSKAELLYEIVSSSSNEALAMTETLPSDLPADERLRQFIRQNVDFLTKNSIVAGVFFQEGSFFEDWLDAKQVRMLRMRERKFEAFVESIIRDGQEAGTFRAVFDPRLTVEAILGMTYWYSRQNRRKTRKDAEQIATEWTEIILNGLK